MAANNSNIAATSSQQPDIDNDVTTDSLSSSKTMTPTIREVNLADATNVVKFVKLISPMENNVISKDQHESIEVHNRKTKLFLKQKNIVFPLELTTYLPSTTAVIYDFSIEQVIKFIKHQTHMIDLLSSFSSFPRDILKTIQSKEILDLATDCIAKLEETYDIIQNIPPLFNDPSNQDIIDNDYQSVKKVINEVINVLKSAILNYNSTMEYVSIIHSEKPTRTTGNILMKGADIPLSYFKDAIKYHKQKEHDAQQISKHRHDDILETSDIDSDIMVMLTNIYGEHFSIFENDEQALACLKHFFDIQDDLSEDELIDQITCHYHDVMIDNDLRSNLINYTSEYLNDTHYTTAKSELFTTAAEQEGDEDVSDVSHLLDSTLMISESSIKTCKTQDIITCTGTLPKGITTTTTYSSPLAHQKAQLRPSTLSTGLSESVPHLTRNDAASGQALKSILSTHHSDALMYRPTEHAHKEDTKQFTAFPHINYQTSMQPKYTHIPNLIRSNAMSGKSLKSSLNMNSPSTSQGMHSLPHNPIVTPRQQTNPSQHHSFHESSSHPENKSLYPHAIQSYQVYQSKPNEILNLHHDPRLGAIATQAQITRSQFDHDITHLTQSNTFSSVPIMSANLIDKPSSSYHMDGSYHHPSHTTSILHHQPKNIMSGMHHEPTHAVSDHYLQGAHSSLSTHHHLHRSGIKPQESSGHMTNNPTHHRHLIPKTNYHSNQPISMHQQQTPNIMPSQYQTSDSYTLSNPNDENPTSAHYKHPDALRSDQPTTHQHSQQETYQHIPNNPYFQEQHGNHFQYPPTQPQHIQDYQGFPNPSRQAFLQDTFGSPYSSVQPRNINPDIIKLEGEAKKLEYEIDFTKQSFEQFIDESRDTEYKKDTTTHNYILRSVEKFEKLAFSIISKSQDNLTNMRSLEYLPRNPDLAQYIHNIHGQAESLYTNIKTNLVPIKESLKTREYTSTIDIDDIKQQINMPHFDGKDAISSLNIFEFLTASELFFAKRKTKEDIKGDFIKGHLKDPAFTSCREILAEQEDYKTIKKLLIKKYGRLSNLHQNLSKHHADIGQIPSLQGNSVPWHTILTKVKQHHRLIQKALAVEKHLSGTETFVNAPAYIGNISLYLPVDYQLMEEVDDANNFEVVKRKFDEILYKSEKVGYIGSADKSTTVNQRRMQSREKMKSNEQALNAAEGKQPLELGSNPSCEFCIYLSNKGMNVDNFDNHLLNLRSVDPIYGCPLYLKTPQKERLSFANETKLCIFCLKLKRENHKINRCKGDNMQNKKLHHTCTNYACGHRWEFCTNNEHQQNNKKRIDFIKFLFGKAGIAPEVTLLSRDTSMLTINLSNKGKISVQNLNIVEDSRGQNIPVLDLPNASANDKVKEYLDNKSNQHNNGTINDIVNVTAEMLNRPMIMKEEEAEKIPSMSENSLPIFIMTEIPGKTRPLKVIFDSGSSSSLVRSCIPGLQLKARPLFEQRELSGLGDISQIAEKWRVVLQKQDDSQVAIDCLATDKICEIKGKIDTKLVFKDMIKQATNNKEVQKASVFNRMEGHLDLLFGLRDKRLWPKEIFTLPCGLSLYKNVLKTSDKTPKYSIGGSYQCLENITKYSNSHIANILTDMYQQLRTFSGVSLDNINDMNRHQALIIQDFDYGEALYTPSSNMSTISEGSIPELTESECSDYTSISDLSDSDNDVDDDASSDTLCSKNSDSSSSEDEDYTLCSFQSECNGCTQSKHKEPSHSNECTDSGDLISKNEDRHLENLVKLPHPTVSLLSNTTSEHLRCASCDEVVTLAEYQDFINEYGLILAIPDLEEEDICLSCNENSREPKPTAAKKYLSDLIQIMNPPSPYFKCETCRKCTHCKTLETISCISLKQQNEERLIKDALVYDKANKIFVSKLPSIVDLENNIKDNYNDAYQRYKRELTKIKNNKDAQDILRSSMDKMIENKYAVKLNDLPQHIQDNINSKKDRYFFPYSIVEKQTSFTSPYRVVFDASFRGKTGISLNDCLASGVNDLSLDKPLSAFMAKSYVLNSDLKKFYNSIRLHEEHYNMQLLFYSNTLDPDVEPDIYVLTVLMFGVRSSPRTMEKSVEFMAEQIDNPLLKDFLSSRYVDDLINSYDNIDEVNYITENLQKELDNYNFKCKYFCRSYQDPPKEATENGIVNVAGYRWRPKDDKISIRPLTLYFKKKIKGKIRDESILTSADNIEIVDDFVPQHLTLRNILSKVSCLFDPFHFLLPFTTMLKDNIRQTILEIGCDWKVEPPVSPERRKKWVELFFQMMNINTWYQRNPIPLDRTRVATDLAVLTDSGNRAKAQLYYLIHELDNGDLIPQYLRGRSQLSDNKSIPCSELDSCEKGVTFAAKVKEHLPFIRNIRYYVDSEVILYWICNFNLGLTLYNRSRVSQIVNNCDISQIHWIDGRINTADKPTKACDELKQMIPTSEFLKGPYFLKESHDTNLASKTVIPSHDVVFSDSNKADAKQGFLKDAALVTNEDNKAISALEKRYQFSDYIIDPLSKRWTAVLTSIAIILKFMSCITHKLSKRSNKWNNIHANMTNRFYLSPIYMKTREILLNTIDTNVETKIFLNWNISYNKLFSKYADFIHEQIKQLFPQLIYDMKIDNVCNTPILTASIPEAKIKSIKIHIYKAIKRFEKQLIQVETTSIANNNICITPTGQAQKVIKSIMQLIIKILRKNKIKHKLIDLPSTFSIGQITTDQNINANFNNNHKLVKIKIRNARVKPQQNIQKKETQVDIQTTTALITYAHHVATIFKSFEEFEHFKNSAIMYFLLKSTAEVENFYDTNFIHRHAIKIGEILYAKARLMGATSIIDELSEQNINVIDLNVAERLPVIDGRSPIGHAMVKHVHQKLGHGGTSTSRLNLLKGIYVFNANETIKRVLANCPYCRIKNKTKIKQLMGPIPKTLHFNSVGYVSYCDLSGPYYVKSSRKLKDHNLRSNRNVTIKIWTLHLVCAMSSFSTVEIVEGYDADSFIVALNNISSTFGMPKILLMDGSTAQMKAAAGDHFLLDSKLHIYRETGVDVRICGATPSGHSRHGKVERSIRSLQSYLELYKTSIQELSMCQFRAAISQAAAIMNSLPMATNPRFGICQESQFITPFHFFNGRRGTDRIPINISEIDPESPSEYMEKLYDIVKGMRNYFVNRLPDLLLRPKQHFESNLQPELNSVVIFKKQEQPTKIYGIGTIVGLRYDGDGVPRIVEIEYSNSSEISYPLSKNKQTKISVIKRIIIRKADEVSIIYSIKDKRFKDDLNEMYKRLKENQDCSNEDQAIICNMGVKF